MSPEDEHQDRLIDASALTGLFGLPISISSGELGVPSDTVVANLHLAPAQLVDLDGSGLAPRASSVLSDVHLRGGPLLAAESFLAHDADGADLPRHLLETGWVESLPADAEQSASGGDRSAPSLLRSPTTEVGEVFARPCDFTETGALAKDVLKFRLLLTLWFASGGTDCGVHRDHDFLEHHVQLHGRGRMQKFHGRGLESMYEEQLLSRGSGQPGFHCTWSIEDNSVMPVEWSAPVYPWHQYRADTDSVFAVIEYHPGPAGV